MAEFCKQCADEMDFESDFTDLFTRDAEPVTGNIGYDVLCEGCGNAWIVDDSGTCGSTNCFKKHGKVS